ncbi:MAG: histidine--tRNA ligase [Clostridia bacterium]|nr:histidine--tRNA ligase [Clostridia bacterium]
MAQITAPKGTQDVLPKDSARWQRAEAIMRELCAQYGFKEIRTPVFEHTEVFVRGVGETTDVVTKEMYTFEDKGGRSVTLRPEGTAGIVRSFVENGLFNEALPQKLYYMIQCFRYEKPQKGRLREFHQFGLELFGAADPITDATVIALPHRLFKRVGLKGISLELNSIGCKECRGKYREALIEYFKKDEETLCATCRERLEKNPMRILDCKSEICRNVAKDAPLITDYLCGDCSEHFEAVKGYLDAMQIDYRVNPRIVRGLDYYNRTVFEFVSDQIGAQGTVCGGGRYDGMTEQFGGAPQPGIGFAMGMERFMLVLEQAGIDLAGESDCDLFLIPLGDRACKEAVCLADRLLDEGVKVQYDLMRRSVKAQMKYADKLGAACTCVIGDSELDEGAVTVKNMANGTQEKIALKELNAEWLEEYTK